MDNRDNAGSIRVSLRLACRLFLLMAAVDALLPAGALSGAEAPLLRARPEIRYEPVTVVSAWGPPVQTFELGRFRVPESRFSGAPSSRQIELAFVRLRTVSSHPGPPIIWLSGGPGDSGTADLATPMLRLFLDLRSLGDVIVLDQRGTGASTPRLDCPGSFQFSSGVPLDRPGVIQGIEAAARVCAEAWRAAGVNLSAYNTRESAEDLEDLRVALGAPKIRVLAGSYGTHLALAAIRAHEDSVDRAALLGVVGPDHLRRSPSDTDEQLARIARLAGSASQPEDLVALVRRVRDGLAARPATVEIESPKGERHTIVVGRFDLEWYTRALLTTREAIAHIPALFAAMDQGDFRELATVAQGWRSARVPSAAIFTHRCTSSASEERESRIAKERPSAVLGDATDLAEPGVCRAWGVSPLPPEFREPVRSAIPILLVSGTLDGDAPESNAAEVLRGFPNGAHLRIEGAAHARLGIDDREARDAIIRFLGGGNARKARLSLPAIAFERREPGRGGPLAAGGSSVAFSSFLGAPR